MPSRYWEDFASCHAALAAEGFQLFLLDSAGETPLPAARLPERTAFVLGHELKGLSEEARASGLMRLRIPQFGPLDSINVTVAASIALYEWLRQHRFAGVNGP